MISQMVSPQSTPLANNACIQEAIDRLSLSGGGRVLLAEGEYTLRNSIFLRDNILLAGEPGAILKSGDVPCSPICDILGSCHYEFRVEHPDLFDVGMGVLITDDNTGGFGETVATIVGKDGDTFFIDRPFSRDYHPTRGGEVIGIFPMISGYGVEHVAVESLILQGRTDQPCRLGGCRGGGLFLLESNNVRLSGLEIRNYHGDALSFQQCFDVLIQKCHIHHNAGHGLHPGSGSVRYVFEENHIHHNEGCGLYYCLRTTHSHCLANHLHENGQAGISIGERDTHHLIESNSIDHNDGPGISWRNPVIQGGEQVIVQQNILTENAVEMVIPTGVKGIVIDENEFRPNTDQPSLQISDDAEPFVFTGNYAIDALDQRMALGIPETMPFETPAVGPKALPLNSVRHLNKPSLSPWPPAFL